MILKNKNLKLNKNVLIKSNKVIKQNNKNQQFKNIYIQNRLKV